MSSKQTFLHGAIILMAANIAVKIINAFFRIPIYILIGNLGWSYYQIAYNLYISFFVVSTAGLPIAISRMTAVANAEQNYEEEKKIFRLSLAVFVIIGIVGASLMVAVARAFTVSVQSPESYYSVLLLAPTLFLVCIIFAFRGHFQGRQNMVPTAASEVIESLGRLVIGISAAWYAINRGYGLHIVAAFAVSGLTVGMLAGVIFLSVTKLLDKQRGNKVTGFKKAARKNGEIMRELIKIAVPITLSALMLSLSPLIDTFIMPSRLIHAGFTRDEALAAFGSYSAQAISIFNVPNVLVIPFAMSIIPVISMAFADKNAAVIKSTVESTFRVVSIISIPCAFGIAVMSKPILNLIFFRDRQAVEATAPLLSILAFGVMFFAMVAVTNAMLQAQKQERKTIISMGCGISVKLVTSFILVGVPEINRFGMPIATVLCYLTIMLINFYFLVKHTGIVPPIRRTFMKPFTAGAIMSICTVLIYMLLSSVLNSSRIAVVFAILAAAAIYIALTLAFKTLKREDVLLLPRGEKIYRAMKIRNLID